MGTGLRWSVILLLLHFFKPSCVCITNISSVAAVSWKNLRFKKYLRELIKCMLNTFVGSISLASLFVYSIGFTLVNVGCFKFIWYCWNALLARTAFLNRLNFLSFLIVLSTVLLKFLLSQEKSAWVESKFRRIVFNYEKYMRRALIKWISCNTFL